MAFFGGSLWAGYQAWADYFNEVLAVSIDRNYLDLTESCGFYWTLDDVCFASERPAHINRDGRGRLHCEVGQSIGYRSGWGLWHWHGVKVPQFVIEEPARISAEKIDAEKNAEVRRVMLDRFGWPRYLQQGGATLLDEDRDLYDRPRKLWRKAIADDEPLVMVEVINSSPEPDGHHKPYILRVPPDTRKVHDAIAWTFDMKPAEYRTAIET